MYSGNLMSLFTLELWQNSFSSFISCVPILLILPNQIKSEMSLHPMGGATVTTWVRIKIKCTSVPVFSIHWVLSWPTVKLAMSRHFSWGRGLFLWDHKLLSTTTTKESPYHIFRGSIYNAHRKINMIVKLFRSLIELSGKTLGLALAPHKHSSIYLSIKTSCISPLHGYILCFSINKHCMFMLLKLLNLKKQWQSVFCWYIWFLLCKV